MRSPGVAESSLAEAAPKVRRKRRTAIEMRAALSVSVKPRVQAIQADPVERPRQPVKAVGTDRLGRTYNPRVHGANPALDVDGYLMVRRRDEGRAIMGATPELYEIVRAHEKAEPGYAFRFVNDKPARLEKFGRHDWEPVSDEKGVIRMAVGGGLHAHLLRKPKEWHNEDQRAKVTANNANLKVISTPDQSKGQYGSGLTEDSKLV